MVTLVPSNAILSMLNDFIFNAVAAGNQLVVIKSSGYKEQLIAAEVVDGSMLDLGIIVFEVDVTEEQQLALITISDNDLGDDNSGSENTAGLLQASRDVFQQAAAFNWGQARFRIRGLEYRYDLIRHNG